MKKFRQFMLENKHKKKKRKKHNLSDHELKHGVATHFSHGEDRLSDHELKHGVATHFSHGENRKKKLNESGPNDKYAAMEKHGLEHQPNKKLEAPDAELPEHLKHKEGLQKQVLKVATTVAKNHPYEEVPHKEEVKKYTKNSGELNRNLYDSLVRDGVKKSGKVLHHDIDKLDAAVGHHKLKHDLTVYSGVTSRVPNDAAKHPERKVYHPGYISTTLNPPTAASFTKPDNDGNHHVVRIHLKTGQQALPILHHSEYDSENEILLPRGHTLKMSDTPEIHHTDSGWNDGKKEKLHIWDAHIHTDDGDNK